MTASGTSDERFSALVDDFLERHRLGQRPSVECYAAANPELAAEIRRAFPALLMMEEFKPTSGDVTGHFEVAEVVVRGARLEQLGDFRVLREAGRGGMGVVYEAEQESLGRRVALKVLAAHAISDPAQVKRFEREARAAAQLHHTNIVPVFGVGEQEGLHYYVMQFIQGLGLDDVIDEVKRLRSATPTPASPAEFREDPGGGFPTTAMIARSLVTERFTAALLVEGEPAATQSVRPRSSGNSVTSGGPSSEEVMGPSGLSSVSSSDSRYWRSVARVGLQVARALEYAHTQGIFHRDIKPSNLLLDGQGTAWVADFGLAKAVEGDNLTHTGDIVGTIRYMAPERFQGRCDARSDVYALGLTLYEMLALRPAFDQTGRQELIRQVMEEEPPRLRKLDPSIPRDLDTVIQKAIARDPAGRYTTAAGLAEDLELFLDDKPVRARKIGVVERGWKWARRRPAIAALLAGLFMAVVTGLSAVTWQWRAAVAARDEASGNLRAASKAVDTFYTTVSEEYLLNEPAMQPLREKLLKLALPYYQEFASKGSGDPALRVALAKAYLNWGTITGEVRSRDDSKGLLRTAANHFESLSRADPTDLDVQTGLARCYQALAQQSISGDQAGEGFDEAMRASEVWKKVVARLPGEPEPRRMLGRCYDLAGILCHARDSAASKDLFGKARTVLGDAVRDFPGHAELRRQLALVLNNIGTAFRIEGDLVGAEPAFGEAIVISRELLAERPKSTQLQTDLVRSLMSLCVGRLNGGTSLTAIGRDLEEARLVIDRVIDENSYAIEHMQLYIDVYAVLGTIRAEQGQTALARRLLGEALAKEKKLVQQNPLMFQFFINLSSRRSLLAAVEYESGHADVAKRTFGDALSVLNDRRQSIRDAEHVQGYFHALLAATILDGPLVANTATRVAPLLESLREREASLRERAEDNVHRIQLALGYLTVGQLFASSGADGDALKHLETAATLVAPGLVLAPGNQRLRRLKARIETARGTVLDRLGKAGEASAAADRAVSVAEKLTGEDPSYDYDLACALALRARLDPTETRSPSSAVAALRGAVMAGFDNVYKLKHDEYLAPVRGRADFDTLVDELVKRLPVDPGDTEVPLR